MVCHILTQSLSLNLLSNITTADAFHSRHNCNTTVINRCCTCILSSSEVPYRRFFIAIKLYQTLVNQYCCFINSYMFTGTYYSCFVE